MPYELIMVDPIAAQHVSVGRGVTDCSYDLCTSGQHIQQWKTYPILSRDEIHLDGELIGGYIRLNGNGAGAVRIAFGITPRDNGFVVRRVLEVHPTDTVMQKFGAFENDRCSGFVDDPFVCWLRSNIDLDNEATGQHWMMRLRAIQPIRSKISHGKISIYQTRKDADNDRHVAMKAGRAIRYIFPEFSDTEIEVMVDRFREKFSLRNYTLKTGREADDFVRAYSHTQADMDNPRTTTTRKAMAHSCMRYRFDQLPVHPVSVYASGDFEIIWLEDSNGHIAGRCVIMVSEDIDIQPQAGPIYGVCEHSMDMIKHHLDSIIAVGYEDRSSWVGARLNRVEHRDGGFIGPYLDVMPQSLEDDGDHLIVDEDGDINASDYHGVLGSNHYTACTECGDRLTEDEYYHSEHTEENYCECCYNNEHTYCEYASEMVHDSEITDVWVVNGHGNYVTESVSEYGRDMNFIECSDDRYWHSDDVVYCESEGVWVSPRSMDNDYFVSDWDNETYPNNVKCTLADGLDVADSEIVDDDNTWEKNAQGVWIIVEEEDE